MALEEDGDYVMPESPGKPSAGATATGAAAASPASATADSDEEARVPFSAAVVAKHASAILKVLRSEQDGIDAAAAYECLVFLTEHEVPQTMCEWAVDKVPTTTSSSTSDAVATLTMLLVNRGLMRHTRSSLTLSHALSPCKHCQSVGQSQFNFTVPHPVHPGHPATTRSF